MHYISLTFLILLITAATIFRICPARVRPVLLLVASYTFYAAGGLSHLVLLLFLTICTFSVAFIVRKSPAAFISALILTLLPLAIMKYGLSAQTSSTSTGNSSSVTPLLLPLGMSFYTLQALSYLIDVRQGKIDRTRSLIRLALYLAFFPQVLAGPIERYSHLAPQLHLPRLPDKSAISFATKSLLWGFTCKLIVADSLADLSDAALSTHHGNGSLSILFGIIAYSLYIYYDFYAYTVISLGIARLFGVRLSENFDRPYLALGLIDFWRRWHISLSKWLRDYIYIPLGGSRRGNGRQAIAIAVTFLASGLWHGSGANYLLWASLHALLVVLQITARPYFQRISVLPRLPLWLALLARNSAVLLTFLLVSLLWLLFRNSVPEAWAIVNDLITERPLPSAAMQLFQDHLMPLAAAIPLIILEYTGLMRRYVKESPDAGLRLAFEVSLSNILLLCLLFTVSSVSSEFLYYRF